MSCYEQFGWGPDDVRRLPEGEAALLAVYFEELAAFRAEEARKSSRGPGLPGEVEFEVGEDEGYDDDEQP